MLICMSLCFQKLHHHNSLCIFAGIGSTSHGGSGELQNTFALFKKTACSPCLYSPLPAALHKTIDVCRHSQWQHHCSWLSLHIYLHSVQGPNLSTPYPAAEIPRLPQMWSSDLPKCSANIRGKAVVLHTSCVFLHCTLDMASALDCPWLYSAKVCLCLQRTVDMGSPLDWPWLCLNRTQLQTCVT